MKDREKRRIGDREKEKYWGTKRRGMKTREKGEGLGRERKERYGEQSERRGMGSGERDTERERGNRSKT